MTVPVQNLKKVTLAVKTDRHVKSVPFEFIYGVGSEGLCPFEVLLADKVASDTLKIDIVGSRAEETFSHLFVPLRFALEFNEVPISFSLEVEVVRVVDTDSREVVKAIARSTHFSGCGGSCGCGCSG